MIKKITKLSYQVAVVAVLATVAQCALLSRTASAAPAQNGQMTQNAQPAKPAEAGTQTSYRYVAQAGDSYTLIARKAAQTYGLEHKIEVGKAGIIYVETNLTQEAGAPQLAVGQAVEIPVASVKKWMESAKKLSAPDLAAWNHYVATVDFNTAKVGKA